MTAAEVPSGLDQGPPEIYNDDAKAVAVRAQLARILASRQFRGTKRSQEFLRFVIEKKLRGQTDALKERWIGVEIFGRPPDYDTGEDAIVRVKANEVRKRLAQYHAEAGQAEVVDIELPAGSYVPDFRWMAVPESAAAVEPKPQPEVPEPQRAALEPAAPDPTTIKPSARRLPRWTIPATAGLALLAVGLAWFGLSNHSSPADRFWRPFVSSGRAVFVSAEYSQGTAAEPNRHVAAGDAIAMAELSASLARMGMRANLQTGTDVPPGFPRVVFGAEARPQAGMRFVFERTQGTAVIRDLKVPGRRWVWRDEPPFTDYAIVTRVLDPQTREPAIAAAGLSYGGTRIAANFLGDPESLQTALGNLKAGWEKENLQFLLRADVVKGVPGPAKVLETYVWQ